MQRCPLAFPQIHLDDLAVAICISQRYFKWKKELWAQPRIDWPGRGWQGYFSLDVLEEMDSEVEACHSFKIV